MVKRPLCLTCYAFLMGIIALSIPTQIAWAYNYTWSELHLVFTHLTYLNWVIVLCTICLALVALKASKALLLLAPTTVMLVVYNNYIVGQWGEDYPVMTTVLASIIFVSMQFLLLESSTQKSIYDIKSRWWLSDPRVKVNLPIMLNINNQEIILRTHDISASGIFLKTLELQKLINKGEEIEIAFFIDGEQIDTKATVVRKNEKEGSYPSGVGITLAQLNWSEKFKWKNFVKHCQKMA